MRRHAFTLIELMIVVAVMAILAGMVLAGVSALGIGSQKQKSATIIETVRQALELTGVQQGGYPSPADHPLAGTAGSAAAPRFVFQRTAANGGTLLNSTTATESLALAGVGLENLPVAYRDRLALGDDRHADGRIPTLYGISREFIGLLGAPVQGVVEYRRLPPPVVTSPPTVIADPDDLGRYPDNRYLVTSSETPAASRRTLDYVFGASTAKTELNKLGALFEPDEATGAVIAYGRAWSEEPADGVSGSNVWEPGFMVDPEHPVFTGGPNNGQTRWVPYKIRGLAIYDAWGVEILYSFKETGGGARLISAGPDGTFYWSPGNDSVYQTAAIATGPTGDDEDGRIDNVQIVKGADL